MAADRRGTEAGAALKRRQRAVEPGRDIGGVAADHVREAVRVVEADERVGDDEQALREVAPAVGQRHGRLEPGDVVVGEIADDGLAAGLGLLEADEPRAAAEEGMTAEPPLLDRLEQERGRGALAQAEVRAERRDEIG